MAMKESTKRSLTGALVMTLLSGLLVLVIAFFTTPMCIVINGDEEIEVECGDAFEDPGAYVRFGLGEIASEGNVDTSKLGEYEIWYSFITEKVKRTVRVIDTTRPEIHIEGTATLSIAKGDTYVEQGFSAWDIADGDLTDKVWTETDLDTSVPGEYHISYYVSDSSGNTTRERRKVSVTEGGPLTMDMVHFDLDPYYPDVICKETPYDEEKYKKTVFFGDSFIGYMAAYRVGIAENLWSKGGMIPTEVYTRALDIGITKTTYTFPQLMDKYHPETVIILLGNQVSAYWTHDYFRSVMDGIYGGIKAKYPDTNIVIMSLCPFSVEGDAVNKSQRGFYRNDRVNKINAVYCEICRKYGLKFMNVAEVLKDPSNGYCRKDLVGPDYFHLNMVGFYELLDYVQHHMDW